MIHIYATQKLLNTSRLEAILHISASTEGQKLHSWYATLVPTGFQGKMLVMYVHEPSLLTVVCRGKTVKGTWEEFKQRLPGVLVKYGFPPASIAFEASLANEYVVSKTNSASMLGHMNGMKYQLEYMCRDYEHYEDIELDLLEDFMKTWLHQSGKKSNSYTTPIEYWKKQRGEL